MVQYMYQKIEHMFAIANIKRIGNIRGETGSDILQDNHMVSYFDIFLNIIEK